MRTLIREQQRWPSWALPVTAQRPAGNGNFKWYIGGQGGVTIFRTPTRAGAAFRPSAATADHREAHRPDALGR